MNTFGYKHIIQYPFSLCDAKTSTLNLNKSGQILLKLLGEFKEIPGGKGNLSEVKMSLAEHTPTI